MMTKDIRLCWKEKGYPDDCVSDYSKGFHDGMMFAHLTVLSELKIKGGSDE